MESETMAPNYLITVRRRLNESVLFFSTQTSLKRGVKTAIALRKKGFIVTLVRWGTAPQA